MTTEPDFLNLIKLLDKADQLAGNYNGAYPDEFLSEEEFHLALIESIEKLKNGDKSQLTQLYNWFLPSYLWDNYEGKAFKSLVNKIFSLLSKLCMPAYKI